MRIERQNYSVNPWRLLMDDGRQVELPAAFDHPMLGKITISQPVSGNTRKDCEAKALALLEWLMVERGRMNSEGPGGAWGTDPVITNRTEKECRK